MLDIRLIRENPDIVKRDLEKRNIKDKARDIDELVRYDKEWRGLKQQLDDLRHKKNLLTEEILKLKKEGKGYAEKLIEAKKIPQETAKTERLSSLLKEKISYIMDRLPNIMHGSVPKGAEEKDNKVIRKFLTPKKFKFKVLDHEGLGAKNDLLDVGRAAKVSGARFYYLKNELALMEFALINFVSDSLIKEGFKPIIPPVLVRKKALYGTGFLPLGEENIYKIEHEDLALVGTSEVSLGAMHMDEIFEKKDLPRWYFAFSSCFRTEAGAHGKDTKGIFRSHQFDKIEMFKFCRPEESWKEHEHLLKVFEGIYKKLKLPYRVVILCSGQLGITSAKTFDIEVWFPSQNMYREVGSCSNCTDFQARRLNVKHKKGNELEYVHTLNSTACAIGRTLVAVIENYQQKDGSITVPTVLQKYMKIKRIKK